MPRKRASPTVGGVTDALTPVRVPIRSTTALRRAAGRWWFKRRKKGCGDRHGRSDPS